MPVFNRPELLLTAVKSVLAQTFRNWELIIVDDGSTDDIAGALRPLLADPRIRLVRQQNRGECVARNNGVRLARGEIVAYLDSDNFWYPHFLAAAVEVFRADPDLDIAYGAIAYDWPNGDVRFYVRLMLPSRECLEFECSEQVYHACGEGMYGQASVQNKWLGQFVGYVGGAPDPNVPNFKP